MQVTLIAFSTALLLTGPQPGSAGGDPAVRYTVPDGCRITLIEEVDVPAQEAGVLKELKTITVDAEGNQVSQDVHAGLEVSENQVLGQIDDEMEVQQKKVAEYKLQVAQMEAGNDVNVRYARKAAEVAAAEVLQAEEANRRYSGTVPPAELNRKRLAREQARLQIEQSEHELKIAGVSVLVREAEDGLAALQLDRRRIVAPLDGIVVERYVDEGEWVRPGDPVLRIIRINRVRLEGFVDASRVLPSEVKNQEVEVRLDTAGWGPASPNVTRDPVRGRVVFASPEVEAGRFLIRAEVDNVWVVPDPAHPKDGYWLLRPGLTAEMTIKLNRIPPARQTARIERP